MIDRAHVAWRPLAILAAGYFVLVAAFATRYGYHRDELYFIAIGGHPAFGYVDEPPLVPLLAHTLDAVSGGSLLALRLPSALAGALVLVLTGLLAREFGAGRGGQLLAAGAMALAAVLTAVSHLMSTSTFDLLGWTVTTWLVVRALRDGGRAWLLAGLAAGCTLEVKTLLAFFLFALLVGIVALGPRGVLRDRWLWAGALLALVLWLPNLWWQASNGWPQLTLSKAIASGDSGTSASRLVFVPYQLLLVSPVLCPLWIAGLVRLARSPMLRTWRCLAVAYAVLVVIFVGTGGKPYYLAGMFPVLLAAGAEPGLRWLAATRLRRAGFAVATGLSAFVAIVVFLPVLPPSELGNTPVLAINYDAGEQIGWPLLVAAVERAYDAVPPAQRVHTVVLTVNYGEAGALLHAPGAPPTYSGHNSLWDLGPPPASTTTVVAVGYAGSELRRWFTSVRRVATFDNGLDLGNDEQGTQLWLATQPRHGWATLWPQLRRLG